MISRATVLGGEASFHEEGPEEGPEEGSGPPVLYLHGFPNSGYMWRKVSEVVSEEYRTLAPDLPGFGDTDLPYPRQGWRELVGWIDAFVDQVAGEPVHLGVHDWGGLVGLPWMCEHPEKVRSLLVTNTSFSSKDRWHALAVEWRKPGIGEEMLGSMTKEGFAAMMSSMAATPVPPDAIEDYWKCLATAERQQAALELYRSLDFEMFEPYMAVFPRVATGKTRLIWGGDDPFVPVHRANRMAELLGTEVTVLEGSHFIQEDAGDQLGKLHREFLGLLR